MISKIPSDPTYVWFKILSIICYQFSPSFHSHCQASGSTLCCFKPDINALLSHPSPSQRPPLLIPAWNLPELFLPELPGHHYTNSHLKAVWFFKQNWHSLTLTPNLLSLGTCLPPCTRASKPHWEDHLRLLHVASPTHSTLEFPWVLLLTEAWTLTLSLLSSINGPFTEIGGHSNAQAKTKQTL